MTKKNLIYLAAALASAGFLMRKSIADTVTAKSIGFNQYDPLFKSAATKYGIPWLYVKAIAWNESSVGQAASVQRGIAAPNDKEGSKSSDGLSWGIMQVTIPTANDLRPGTTFKDLNDPTISIDLGAKYLSQMMKRYGGDITRAVRAYNQGPGNEDKRKPYADEYLARFQDHYAKLLEINA